MPSQIRQTRFFGSAVQQRAPRAFARVPEGTSVRELLKSELPLRASRALKFLFLGPSFDRLHFDSQLAVCAGCGHAQQCLEEDGTCFAKLQNTKARESAPV
jgi:hypothetical protein